MERIRAMEYERDEHRKALGAILATAEKAGRALSPEETARGEIFSAKVGELEAKISLERASIEFDRTKAVAIAGPGGFEPKQRVEGAAGGSVKYRDLFGAAAKSEHFPDWGPFLNAVAAMQFHPGLRATATEGLGSEGGFLVPSELSAESFDTSLEDEIIRPRARVYSMQSDARGVAGYAMDGGASGPYGWQPGWVAEAGTLATETPLVRKCNLVARKLGVLVCASRELLEDGLNYAAQLQDVMRKALSFSMDSAFLTGNGVGKPLGILNSPATIEVAKVGGQAADSLVSANVLGLYGRLLPGSYKRAIWVIHPSVKPQLYALALPVGVGGVPLAGTPLFTIQNQAMTLLGIPVLESEKVPPLGDRGDVSLIDPSMYAVGLRREIVIDRSMHAGFSTDTEWFRATLRVAGLPLIATPYTPASGPTLSPFVTLGERA